VEPAGVALVKLAAVTDSPQVIDPEDFGGRPSGSPVFSPRGQFLAVRSGNDSALWIYRTRDLRPALVLHPTPEPAGRFWFTDDDTRLYTEYPSGVRAWEIAEDL